MEKVAVDTVTSRSSDTSKTLLPTQGPTRGVGSPYVDWIYKLDAWGVETRGIERVTPAERRQLAQQSKNYRLSQFVHVAGLWFAACGGLTSMLSFFLPTLLFGLNLRDALISGIISMVIGCLVPAYTSTMGAKSGCRQMVSARFLFGQWGVKFVALVCIVGGIGWLVVNCVVGGQVLAAVLGVDLLVGIVVISILSLVIAVFGIRVLLKFQTILSVPITIAVVLFYVNVCKKIGYIEESNAMIRDAGYSPTTSRGNWLSFFTVGYSVTATWGSGAADYYILFPDDTPSIHVFLMTFLGIAIPTTFVAVVGTLAGTISYAYTPWHDAYAEYGIGGIINAAFEPWGRFGQFVLVVLFFSLVCNNIMNTYSCAFEFQLIDAKLALVPRWIWALLVMVIYLVLSLVGKSEASAIILNFLPMLGYWVLMYISLLLEENLLFRFKRARKLHHNEFEHDYSSLYNWDKWDSPHNITHGLAASAAFAAGVVGAVLGMNQVYYRGPLADKLGEYGGDIGFWLAMAFSAVVYPPLRLWELKRFGR